MSLPFLWLAASFTAGILIAQGVRTLPLRILPAFFVWLPFLWIFRGRKIFMPLLCTAFMILGILYGQFDRTAPVTDLETAASHLDLEKSLALVGKVKTEPEVKTRGRKVTVSFILEATRLPSLRGRRIRPRPSVFSNPSNVQVFLTQPERTPEIGDELRLWGRLKPLPEMLNPGGFDYRQYLQDRDVCLLMNVYGPKSVQFLAPGEMNFQKMLSRVRGKIAIWTDKLFLPLDAAFVKALTLGDRKNLSSQWKNDFLKTGTSHLLAISGLNIAMVAGSFYLLLIALGIPQKPAALAALLGTIFQVFIAGLGIPVQRAGIMAGLGFLALLLERERNGLNIFFLSFLALLVLDTRSLFNVSFQLSFLSLFCLILFSHYWPVSPPARWPWLEAVAGSLAVLAGTFPVVAYHFNTFSPIGIVTNLLAIPLFHLVQLTSLVALFAGGVPFLGAVPVQLCHFFLSLALGWIHLCAQPHWGYWFLVKPSLALIFLYYALLGLFLILLSSPNGLVGDPKFLDSRLKHAGMTNVPAVPGTIIDRSYSLIRNAIASSQKALLATTFALWLATFAAFFRPSPGSGFELTVFAAGSNELAHLQFEDGNHWLINAGRSVPSDQAEWILSPYLRAKAVKKIKGILFTDYLKRHTAGFDTLRRNFIFDYAVYPVSGKRGGPSPKSGVTIRKGGRIRMPDGSAIEILDDFKGRLTLGIQKNETRFLMLPTIQPELVRHLEHLPFLKRVDVLILPSPREIDAEALRALVAETQPKWVAVPAKNPEIEKILKEGKAREINLQNEGAVTFRVASGASLRANAVSEAIAVIHR